MTIWNGGLFGGGAGDVADTDLDGLIDGFNLKKIDIKPLRVADSKVHLDFEAEGGGDIPFVYSGTDYVYDCSTNTGPGGLGTVELIQGTIEEPIWQFIYMVHSETAGKPVAVASQIIPTGIGFAPIAYALIGPSTDVAINGPTMIQRITDIPADGYRGALSYLREKIRLALINNRITGGDIELEITTNTGARDNVTVKSTTCQFYQLHKHEMLAKDAGVDGIRIIGQDIGACDIDNYSVITDLGLIAETGNGTDIVDGDTIAIDIIGIGNSLGLAGLGAVIAKEVHTVAAEAVAHAQIMSNMRHPKDLDQVCFTLARIVLTYTDANGGTWTNALSSTTTVWNSEVIAESTPSYPGYLNNTHEAFGTVHTYPGATAVRCHFRDFVTEANYDFVRLQNAAGDNVHSYHGSLAAFTSANISGDTIKFYFDSDGSVTRAGAFIDKIEYQETITSGGGQVFDRR